MSAELMFLWGGIYWLIYTVVNTSLYVEHQKTN